MRIGFITLFPELVPGIMGSSILGRAQDKGLVSIQVANPRDFASDARKTVDDRPFGGGPGMVMLAEPIHQAILSLTPEPHTRFVAPDPTGPLYNQSLAKELSQCGDLILVCGHYEGIDQRVLEFWNVEPVSMGDFILTGGELPALTIADSVIRLLPGALGDAESLQIDSLADGLLSAPQYTRPEVWNDLPVPPVLLTGNHGLIAKWRRSQSLHLTRQQRPDLFCRAPLVAGDVDMLSS